MKLLIYLIQPLFVIWAALKWEWLALALAGLFAAGAVAAVVFSIVRHISANLLSRP